MTQLRYDDETLMAFADGELDAMPLTDGLVPLIERARKSYAAWERR